MRLQMHVKIFISLPKYIVKNDNKQNIICIASTHIHLWSNDCFPTQSYEAVLSYLKIVPYQDGICLYVDKTALFL